MRENYYKKKFFSCAQNLCIKVKTCIIKGSLMQIWECANIFVFKLKQYVEDFTLKHILLFEIWAGEICEKLLYKHSETIEYVKN